jgi:hypothetical protein
MKLEFPLEPGKNCTAWAFVGSRVTCDPAPTDTDRDVLVLCIEGEAGDLANMICAAGGNLCGEDYDEDNQLMIPYRMGDDNYLLTEDEEYFFRFMAVTQFAKEMNFMDKKVRKSLFHAALDGHDSVPRLPVNWAPPAPINNDELESFL